MVDVSSLEWLWSMLSGLVAMLLVVALFHEDTAVDEDGLGGSVSSREWQGSFLKTFGWLVVILGQFYELAPVGRSREKLRKRLIQAGSPGRLTPDEWWGVRTVAAGIGFFVGAYFDFELNLSPIGAIGFAVLGFVYPDIWLSGAIEKRQRRIFRDLPDTLDTLRLAVDAGLDLGSAMAVLIEQGKKGPLLDELEIVQREMAVGVTRRDAFKNFAKRTEMTEINAFVVALNQADQLGASIGPILKVQAEVARTRRWQLAETLVNKMPMKMLGPLVAFIFPSSFIVLFTPLLIQYMQTK